MSENELILGKYKDGKELEKAYTTLKKGYDELKSNSNKFSVPEDYAVSERTTLIDTKLLEKARDVGKKYGFTQTQYEEFAVNNAQESMARNEKAQASSEEKAKAMAEVADIEDIKKHWQEDFKMSEKDFSKLSIDGIKQLGELRQKSLNSSTTISSQANVNSSNLSKTEIYSRMENSRRSGNMTDFNNMMQLYKS